MVTRRAIARLLLLVALAAMVAACGRDDGPGDPFTFRVGESRGHLPWTGEVHVDAVEAEPGGSWTMAFDLDVDLRNMRGRPDVIESLVVAVVGEQVYDENGTATGLTTTSISSRFTSAGIPLAYYHGILPVRALGSRQGSPFEGIHEFSAGDWARGGRTHLTGRIIAQLPADTPPGYYRPHVDLFVRFRGSRSLINLGRLASILELPAQDPETLIGGWAHKYLGRTIGAGEFVSAGNVLPEVVVGRPATPHLPWTIFHDHETSNRSGLLPVEDQARCQMLNRAFSPAAFRVSPGRYTVYPGLPSLSPNDGLTGMFLERIDGVNVQKNFLRGTGSARAVLTDPGGTTVDLGEKRLVGIDEAGQRVSGGGFLLDLQQTGDYALQLTGRTQDRYQRDYTAGGTYRFTVAMPISFSTPVKPGTNFLVGARYPSSFHLNPAVPAQVRLVARFFPNSDPERMREVVYEGPANRFGHFVGEGRRLAFDEPGEYYSHLEARYLDPAGRLWMGAQSSAGVIAPREPEVILHGGTTHVVGKHDDRLSGVARFTGGEESTCPYLDEPSYSGTDYIIPYISGDTVFVGATYPFESALSNALSIEVPDPALAARIVAAYNPGGEPYNDPSLGTDGAIHYEPDAWFNSADDLGTYLISAASPYQLPVMSANAHGWNPYQFPSENLLEGYTYLSVIRPGFQVLNLAYSQSHMQTYWIISPNAREVNVKTRPNGDMPGDVYRVMAGVVIKDLAAKRNYYDAYASAIVSPAPGLADNAVVEPGGRPLLQINGRDQYYCLGMDTSVVYFVGDPMMLGGTVMPPAEANVSFAVTKPDGAIETVAGRSNRLGQTPAPRPVFLNQPGVYRVRVLVERDGKSGDVAGSGDGEFFNFAVPHDGAPLLHAALPPVSATPIQRDIHVPLRWPAGLTDITLTHSINMPGFLLDEGQRRVSGEGMELVLRPHQWAIQYPFLETFDHGTGKPVQADTIVVVLFFEATRGAEKVYDAIRLILRDSRLLNSRALFAGKPAVEGANLFRE
ncbi:MAG: hypothetical protein P9L99_10925 [Candidatus Lernaella stagnicola]|nr:hypothetical protein [Candidatus Lernaella stagnicola]